MTADTQTKAPIATRIRRLLTLRTKMFMAFGGLFVVTVSAAVLVGLYGIPFTGFGGEYRRQQEAAFAHLNFVADRKKAQLQKWITERKTDAYVLSRNRQMSDDVARLLSALRDRPVNHPTDDQLWAEVQQLDAYRSLYDQLSMIQSAYPGYESVSIADWSTFSVIVSTDPGELGQPHANPQRSESQQIINSGEAFVGDISAADGADRPALHIGAPIWADPSIGRSGNEVIGLLILQISSDELVKPIFSAGGELGNTWEALLVDRYRRILIPLKYPLPDGSKATPFEYCIDAKPATLAAQGKEGLVASLDYRGEPVMAAYRYIEISPEIGWGMVAKMDESEVYASLNKIVKFTFAAGTIITILVLVLIVLISRHLSRPIAELARVAGEVQTGNLDTRAPTFSNDEIDLLGRAFNAMIGQIDHWHKELENKVEARTVELKNTITELAREINGRKEAQESLKESEALYHSLVETSQNLIWKCDAKGRLTFLNKAWHQTHGYTNEEMLGRPFQDFQTPKQTKRDAEEFSHHLAGGSVTGYETTHISKSGDTIHLVFNAVPLFDKAGRIIGTQGTAYDITQRKSAELALRESEERYRSIYDTAATLITSVNRHGILVDCNRQMEKVLGYSRDEIVGQSIAKIIHPDGLAQAQQDLQQILTEGYLFQHEHRMVRKDGRVIDVVMNSSGLMGPDGEYERTICIIDDITDRKRTSVELEKSISLLEATLESTADGILVVDHDGKVIQFNQRFLDLWTIPKAVADTRDDEKLLQHVLAQLKEPSRFIAKVRDLYGNPEASSMDILEFRDGRIFERLSLPQRIGDNIVGRVWSFRDISETRRLQNLEARAQRLETAGQIAGQVAHDFNNLLAPMLAYPEFIREELPDSHPALPFLSDIEKGAKQIAEINQQLLTLGRRGHYNQEPLNLNTIVKDAIKMIAPLPEKLSCQTILNPDLMNIMGGSAQLQRVLSNLINNACDAMKNDGTITISTENYYVDNISVAYGRVPRGEYVKLTISDTGHGIPEEVAQQVFDPFFTTKTADKRRGSGLGLSVVDAVVRDHNGYIDLNSKPNEGTSFYLYFPTTRDAVGNRNLESIEGGTETVLVVDDDQMQREVSTKMLQALGYETSAVESGEQAVEFLKETSRDLLVLDMIMPGGIDGAETYHQALKINPSQRAVIVSGYAESDRVQSALGIGAGAFIRKPLTRRILAAAVRKELDKGPVLSIS